MFYSVELTRPYLYLVVVLQLVLFINLNSIYFIPEVFIL